MPQPNRKLRVPPRRSKEKLEARNQWCAQQTVIGATLFSPGGGDIPIGDSVRRDLLQRLRAGEPIRVEMEAVTYLQGNPDSKAYRPNRNFVRFKPSILAAFARSFAGVPFLRDHGQRKLEDRGGTITASKLETDGETLQIRQRFEIVKPWAVESALDGTLDRFSIGWSRTATVECSICMCDWIDCAHWPGDRLEDGRIVELVFTGAEGVETSGVNVPAVLGTRIEAIQQLTAIDPAELTDILEAENDIDDEVIEMDPKILQALGLPATATVADVEREIQSRNDRLTLETERATTATAQAAQLAREAETRAAAQIAAEVEDTITRLITNGKIKPGSASENALRSTAKRDVEAFRAFANDLLSSGIQVTPVGAPLPALKQDPQPQPMTGPKQMLAERPELRRWLAKAGISEAQFEQHGADGVEILNHIRAQRGF